VRTIVCGIDGSPGARSALRIATELAGALRLRVVAVHVADSFGDDHTSDAPSRSCVCGKRREASRQRPLRRATRGPCRLADRGWQCCRATAAVAAEEQALLILLGARSKGKPWTFLRSRLAGEIVRKSSVPVIVVPPQGELEVAPPRIVEPSGVAAGCRVPSVPGPPGAPDSAKSR
jgi:K+-sensing histidine kinase KdpD